eukprot:tig00000605_g2512.t1
MGVLDETDTLEEGEVFVQYRDPQSQRPVVLRGPVVVAKNPCLHPGDVRVVQAVGPRSSLKPERNRFPDYMLQKAKPSYESPTVLGRIFRSIDKIVPPAPDDKGGAYREQLWKGWKPDPALYWPSLVSDEQRRAAQHSLAAYTDELTRIMNQYGIRSEVEAWTGIVLKFTKYFKRKHSDGDLQLRIRGEVRAL